MSVSHKIKKVWPQSKIEITHYDIVLLGAIEEEAIRAGDLLSLEIIRETRHSKTWVAGSVATGVNGLCNEKYTDHDDR